jgi:DNA invertase Pin-like site-specific DNA recombinase
MTKVVLFVRVSSSRQDYQRQVDELTEEARKNNWEIIATIEETVSATKTRLTNRPSALQLLDLAQSGKINKVLVWEVSRLGRKPLDIHTIIERLTDSGVSLYIHKFHIETLLPDKKRNPLAGMLLAVFAELAYNETELLSDRIKSGMQAAKRKGKHTGRKKGTTSSSYQLLQRYDQVARYLKKGTLSIREIAAVCDVSKFTVEKVKKAMVV